MKDFLNTMDKNVYYIVVKSGYSYQIRPFIYDSKIKQDKEATQEMSWISFHNLFFAKESLFLITSVGKPIHLHMTTTN